MDYSKSGGPKGGRSEPRPVYHPNAGGKSRAGNDRNDKAALLARMKAKTEEAKDPKK